MPIKVVVTEAELETVPEAIRSEYVQGDDGSYHLQAEGIDDHPAVLGLRRTLKKFRDVEPNADRLKARLDKLSPWETFADRDPSDVKDRLKKLEELEAAGGDPEEVKAKFEELYQKRLKAANEEHGKQLAAKESETAELRGYIEREVLDNGINRALEEVGVAKEVRKGAKALLKELRPKVVADPEKGFRAVFQTELGDLDAADYVKKWAASEEAKGYMPPSGNNGTGAGSGGPGGPRHHRNPWSKDTFNLTEQGRIQKESPDLARQLASAAGSSIG